MKIEINNAFGKVFLTVEYDASRHLVHNMWMGYQTLESVMLGANACLEMVERFKCPFILNDNRLVVGPWNHATDWIADDWSPRAVALGLSHFAIVVSQDSLAALSAETMAEKVTDSYFVRIFGEFDQARQWLASAKRAITS